MVTWHISDVKKGDKNMEPLTLTVTEAAQLLRISRNSAYNLAKEGKLPTVKLGRRLLVPTKALNELLAGNWQPPKTS